MNSTTIKAGFNISAIVTGCFTLMIGFIIYTAQGWIANVNTRFERDELRFQAIENREISRNDRITILEQEMRFQSKQLETMNEQLKSLGDKIDIIVRKLK